MFRVAFMALCLVGFVPSAALAQPSLDERDTNIGNGSHPDLGSEPSGEYSASWHGRCSPSF
jgi:hypothetical protein